jgi:hypothetical protein
VKIPTQKLSWWKGTICAKINPETVYFYFCIPKLKRFAFHSYWNAVSAGLSFVDQIFTLKSQRKTRPKFSLKTLKGAKTLFLNAPSPPSLKHYGWLYVDSP